MSHRILSQPVTSSLSDPPTYCQFSRYRARGSMHSLGSIAASSIRVEILWKGLELFQDPSSPFILQKLLWTLLLAPQHPGERLALLVLGNRLIKHAHIFIIKGPCSSSKTQFRNLIACYISSSLFLSGKTTRSVEALLPCLINWR